MKKSPYFALSFLILTLVGLLIYISLTEESADFLEDDLSDFYAGFLINLFVL